MIYLFHGTDVAGARRKAFAWIAAAREKAPDAAYLRIESGNLSPEALGEALGAQGLFFSRSLVLIDDPFETEGGAELILSMLEELAASPNPVAILAPKLHPARAKKIEAKSAKTFSADLKAKAVRGFNSGLVNALAEKNGKVLWKEIVHAERLGDAPEMIHGLLHWKVRELIKKGGRGWTKDEARRLSRSLIELLSDSRGKDLPLSLSLERFALSLG